MFVSHIDNVSFPFSLPPFPSHYKEVKSLKKKKEEKEEYKKATTPPVIAAEDLCFRHSHLVKEKIQILECPISPNLQVTEPSAEFPIIKKQTTYCEDVTK